ncbi:MAG TPA: bacillithiol biosynthesis cysteine-adding enzyme BshC [Ginsengibacter sp.]|nr:bacillithiol biosynthesis cysteine-adding enzyme BshC [Ginsengibacter sp.]
MSKAFQTQYIPYSATGKFAKIILDYVAGANDLKDFYEHAVNLNGTIASINGRKNFNTNRKLLVEQLQLQYKNLADSGKVKANIDALSNENTFTVCTAHQPNIFTGHLYFIYKILHTIKLADDLKKQLPTYNFVPVFFMGSEDADLEELNHIVVDGKKYVWNTKQTGAVGRMKVDDNLLKLIDEIEGRLSVEEYGKEIIELLKKCFQKDSTIQHSTFLMVHELFKNYGLIVFLPDNGSFKNEMSAIFEEDIFENTSSKIVNKTSEKLSEKYKVQAHPREINLFYLKDDIRNRIVQAEDHYIVHDTKLVFTKDELKDELKNHPERFSPNVILRGLYQEIMLPNIAFIGGGGEIAYWLELKDLFQHYKVPFPLLIVRNSFLIIEKRYHQLMVKLGLLSADLFKGEETLVNEIVATQTNHRLKLDEEKFQIQQAYYSIKKLVKEIDVTLEQHTEALETKSLKKLSALEKKMFRAEKRKFEDQKNQLSRIFAVLFPQGNLQERTENFMLYYSRLGDDFLKILYENSLTLEQEFCVIEEN